MFIHPEEIKDALGKELPGSSSHMKMLPRDRNLKVTPENESGLKRSSVLLLLYPDEGTIYACLIKRPVHMKHHAGQIALPGGRIETNETALETALRETQEEIGILPGTIKILGSLSELYVEVSRFLIRPFVGWLDKKPDFSLNKNEVEKIISFPLLSYKNQYDSVELETLTGRLRVPCIKFRKEIIWGATAMIISEFYDAIDHLFKDHI